MIIVAEQVFQFRPCYRAGYYFEDGLCLQRRRTELVEPVRKEQCLHLSDLSV